MRHPARDKAQDVPLRGRGPLPQHDGGPDGLAQRRVGDRKRDRLADRFVFEEDLVDLARRDLLSSPVDDLLQPTRDRDVALLVDDTRITGAEPAAGESRGVRLRPMFVAAEDVGTAHHDLTHAAGRQQLAALVHDGHGRAGGQAHRPGLSHTRGQRVARHLVRGLRHAIRLDDRDAEHRLQFSEHPRRQRGRRRPDKTQAVRASPPGVLRRAGQDRLVHRRNR